ncbi:MAG: hypothetical protein K0S44_293 [Bacteroidetes bacterium]|jgi:photosystem II stability/assembly factor-like uncharacterized protein|nr:hypothetical protein [Bacteroidota bacterium]
MKKIILFAFIFFCIKANAQWNVITPGSLPELRSVFFTSVDTGYAVGNNGKIIQTVDGGVTWNTQASGLTDQLNSVFFATDSIGFIVGRGGKILKTADQGANWISQTSGIGYPLNGVYFVDADTGYAVGEDMQILKTINGGDNWLVQTYGSTIFYKSVYFTDKLTGYVVGKSGMDGVMRKTTNGGITWSVIGYNSANNNSLNAVYFTSADTGYVVGGAAGSFNNSLILKTTDGGINWSPQTAATIKVLNSVHFIDKDTGYVVGNSGTIFKTINGGLNWNLQVSNNTWTYLHSVFFPAPNIGYAVGRTSYGLIIKTGGAGSSVGIAETEIDENTMIVYPNPSNSLFTISGTAPGDFLIINQLGQTIQIFQLNENNNYSVTIPDLKSGVYYVIGNNEEGFRRKVVVSTSK